MTYSLVNEYLRSLDGEMELCALIRGIRKGIENPILYPKESMAMEKAAGKLESMYLEEKIKLIINQDGDKNEC